MTGSREIETGLERGICILKDLYFTLIRPMVFIWESFRFMLGGGFFETITDNPTLGPPIY